jgi:uncharacterized protein (TIGR02646 family)
MKRIHKQASPPLFENWKTKWRARNDTSIKLEDLYEQEGQTGDGIWKALQSKESPDRLYSLAQLRLELVEEQGFICCYCNREIAGNKEESNVEHFKAKGRKEYFPLVFDYNNLLASCNGFEKTPKPRYTCCNSKRQGEEDLPLSPLQGDIESHFDFTIDGQIIGLSDAANDMIHKLGLDIDLLDDLRKTYIRNELFENPFSVLSDYISKEKAERKVAELELEKQKGSKFSPFGVAIIKVLKNEILKLKT